MDNESKDMVYHVPVMLEECIEGLNIKANGVYADVTFGAGGHSRRILAEIGRKGHLYSFDQDADAEKNAEGWDRERFTFVRSNFRFLKNFLRYYGCDELDGLLADLGVSSHHLDDSERGFSFRYESKLDMRMNQRAGMTAADVLNTYSEKQLADIFYLYGELKQSRKMAAAIVKARADGRIDTVQQLVEVLKPFFRNDREKKDMAKAFQAIRIEVNHEMDALREMLKTATEMLKPGGRLVVMTYHSLEDRMVKNLMKTGNVDGIEDKDLFGRVSTPFKLITRQPIVPSDDELMRNPRSRSAKLRVAEKCK